MGPTQALSETQSASRREERREAAFIAVIVLPLVLGLGFVSFGCYRLFNAPSSSMAPNLPIGSHFVVSRLSYGFTRTTFDWFDLPLTERWPKGEIKRGDIVVFRKTQDRRVQYVKRVVGLGGERVQVKDGRLIINGEMIPREDAGPVPEPLRGYGTVPSYFEVLPDGPRYKIIEAEEDHGHFDQTAEVAVPADSIFVMGDNRDNSSDSRDMSSGGVGFVPIDHIVGKVVANFKVPDFLWDLEQEHNRKP